MQGRRLQWWILVLACLLGLAAAIILAVWLPSLLYGDVTKASPDARLQAASGFRTAFIAGLAGLAAVGSLAMATRTYRLTQQGQITDRYTKAIEQLGTTSSTSAWAVSTPWSASPRTQSETIPPWLRC